MSALAVLVQELKKLAAFMRRDFLVAWSYRVGFVGEIFGLVGQAVLFAFISRLIDPTRIPNYGIPIAGYLEFIVVGIFVTYFLQAGITRVSSAMRLEQTIGTLEAVMATPTSPLTVQIGSAIYDLVVHLPIRIVIFAAIVLGLFDVNLNLSGVDVAAVLFFVFAPCVLGLGAASAAAVLTFRRATSLVGIGLFVLTFTSGAFFPLQLFPQWFVNLARFNPIALVLTGLRISLIGRGVLQDVMPEILMLVSLSVLTFICGVAALELALRRERRLGTLGLY